MVREMALRKAADEAKRAADAKLSDDPTRKFREIGERAQRLAVGTSSTGVTTVGNFIAGKYRSA